MENNTTEDELKDIEETIKYLDSYIKTGKGPIYEIDWETYTLKEFKVEKWLNNNGILV